MQCIFMKKILLTILYHDCHVFLIHISRPDLTLLQILLAAASSALKPEHALSMDSKDISLKTKCRLICMILFPIAIYGKKLEMKKIERTFMIF